MSQAPLGTGPDAAGRRWSRDHRTIALAVLLTLAGLARLVHGVQARDTFIADLHRWEETDMAFFHDWGQRIADGDLLGRQPLHPVHGWHREIAADHFRRHPEDLRRHGGDVDHATRQLWNEWYGGVRYHQEPLYPWLVGLTYAVAGPDPRWVFAWQALLGLGSVLLVFELGRRCFDETTGIVAGALAALAPLPVHFETTLLRPAAITFAGLLATFLLVLARQRPGGALWLATGLAAGAGILLKVTLAPLPLAAMLLAAVEQRREPRRAARSVGLLAVGVALALSPAVVRNVVVGAPPLSLTSVGAITFARVNAADVPADQPGLLSGRVVDVMERSRGDLLDTVRMTIRSRGGVVGFSRHAAAKLFQVAHGYERPNNTNFYFHRVHAPVLRWLPVGTWMVMALATAGLVIGAWRARPALPLYLLVLTHLAPLLVFHVLARYRSPLVVALLPFAALTLVQLARWLRAREWKPAAATLAGVAVMTVVALWPRPPGELLVRATDVARAHRVHHERLLSQAQARGDVEEVARLWGSLSREPPEVRRLRAGRPLVGEEARLAGMFATLHREHARALAALDRADDARAASDRAAELEALAPAGRPP